MIRSQFVGNHRVTHAVKRMSAVVDLNRFSYYKRRDTRPAWEERQQRDQMLGHIRWHCEEWKRTLGYRRVAVELAEPSLAAVTVRERCPEFRFDDLLTDPPPDTGGIIKDRQPRAPPTSSKILRSP